MTAGIFLLGSFGGATGKAQLNIGTNETGPAELINIFKCGGYNWNGIGVSTPTPDILDITSYPVKSFTGSLSFPIGGANFGLTTAGPWVVAWDAGRSNFHLEFLAAANVSASSNATITNGAGSGNFQIKGDGINAGSATFTFTLTPSAGLTPRWDGDAGVQVYAAGSGDITMMRVSDVAAYNLYKGTNDARGIYTPEYLSLIGNLRPGTIRTMGQTNVSGTQASSDVKWAYRTRPASFNWSATFAPGAWCGGAGASGSITNVGPVYTAAPAPDTPLTGWVDGEVFIGNVISGLTPISVSGAVSNAGFVKLTVSSTANITNGQSIWILQVEGTTEANGVSTVSSIDDATHFTINIPFVHAYIKGGFVSPYTIAVTGKTGGAKFIANAGGTPLFGSEIPTGLNQFHYDSVLDRVIASAVTASIPIEAQVSLANNISANLWPVIPGWADDDYVTNLATNVFNNLSSSLFFFPEYDNEVWNPGFFHSQWAFQRGTTLGLADPTNSYYGLRVRQVMGIIGTVWAGRTTQLKRVLASQYAASGLSGTTSNRWGGAQLSSFGFNAKPNRPIDFVEVVAYAPYAGGRSLGSQNPDSGITPTANDVPFLQNLANQWNAGNTAAAIALVDSDIRQGRTLVQTVTASGTTFSTPLAHGLTANSDIAGFQVTGGSNFGGLISGAVYMVSTTPTASTFTIKPFAADGTATGTTVNSGAAATGTVTVGSQGTMFSSHSNALTLQGMVSTAYLPWETAAASFDSDRPVAASALEVHWYEGSAELSGPTTALCFSLGITLPGDPTGATASAAIAAAILAWRNDPMSAATIQTYYKYFMGTDPTMVPTFGLMAHSRMPSNLQLLSGTLWALMPGYDLTAIPWQLYNGVQTFNHT